MKYVNEYRDPEAAKDYAKAIGEITRNSWRIMEICGGQTHSIVKYGIDQLLPEKIDLIHGPGCPVCVTPLEIIDKALTIATFPEVIFCSFGDMLRVPGSEKDLFSIKAEGGDVRIVYSPLDALALARENKKRKVVFLAVGFETTAPGNAMAVHQAAQEGLENFLMLVSHVLVPPAMEAILSAPTNKVQGFLAAGHVCTVMGYHEYLAIAEKYQVPIVVTGFEPLDILQGICMCIEQLESGRAKVENQYLRSVTQKGNEPAQKLLREVFEISTRQWRGIGPIAQSGLTLREKYAAHDAERYFQLTDIQVKEPENCISGTILQGEKKPCECPAFGIQCTPEHPLGATMVSSEGACAAYYQYRGRRQQND